MDFFDLDKTFARKVIPGGASRGFIKSEIESDEETTVAPSESGTEYAAEYVEEENRKFLEIAAQRGTTETNYCDSVSDLISQGTIPNLHEINAADVAKTYNTFNFVHRPKLNLTITSMRDKIVSMIETNQVVVIQGPTGCGKTTQVPQFILDSCFEKRQYCNIIVTQPRRIAAISIAQRVCEERQWPVGTLVGYQVGMINNTSSDTRLTYCTTGVLLQKLVNAKHMMDYTHVILDEVHERDQDMDFLLLVVRKLLRSNSCAVKVVLMSATFNVEKFSNYFSIPLGNKLEPAPVIDIEKRALYNVHTFYLCQLRQLGLLPEVSAEEPKVSRKMMSLCVTLIIILDGIDRQESKHKDTTDAAANRSTVLIFLPGIYEIEEMYSLLTEPGNEGHQWNIAVLHSSITNEEQQRIFDMPPKGHRRIILSTNIAESSITVPDVKYVMDFCLTKQLVTDPKTNFQCLELVWASRTSCKQRAGRAGRVMDGRVYRMVPKDFYEKILPEESDPEMMRSPLETLILKSKLLDMGSPKSILALSLDPPDVSNLERSILLLKETGGLVDTEDNIQRYDGQLSNLGRIMAHLPVNIQITKLIVLGQIFSILRESIIIGASMSMKSMFSTPFRDKMNAYNAKLSWADNSESDCIAYLHAYKLWNHEKANRRITSNASEKAWAKNHFIQIRVLREIDAFVNEITKRLATLGISETTGRDKVIFNEIEKAFVIKIVIAGAFYPNYFVHRAQGNEEREREHVKQLGGCDPNNTVYLQGFPMRQPGDLYVRQLQSLFRECLDSPIDNIVVSFDGSSRVYIQFCKHIQSNGEHKNVNVPGKISLAVYKAIKMRHNDIPLIVHLLDPEVAKQKAEELALPPVNYESFSRKDDTTNNVVKRPRLSAILPGLDISFIPIIITHIDNPGTFWSQLQDEETYFKLNRIDKLIIEQRKSGSTSVDRNNMQIGSLVIAPYADNGATTYCRAIILSYHLEFKKKLAQIFFIDFGNTQMNRIEDLNTVDPESELHDIPGLAFKCVLANVRPSMLCSHKGNWSDSALAKFKDLLRGPVTFFGEIFSIVRSVVAIKLIRVDQHNAKLNINEWLIENGFSEYAEESYLSRQNNERRLQQGEMTHEQRLHYDQQQYDHNYQNKEYPENVSESLFSQTVRLRGPYSPLEMDLMNPVAAGRNKKVHIQPDSVNAVLLDTDPSDPHERLLVAGSIGQNVAGMSLNLRNTTLMPNIHGLPCLIALIFTPTMELRRNSRGTRYIGALCGLGNIPNTSISLFPEHDMNVPFDVEITMDDLQEINRLRYWMNMGIHFETPEHCDNSETATCQNKIKGILMDLIKKRRKSQELRTLPGTMKWNQYDPKLKMTVYPPVSPEINIFKLHDALALETETPGYEEMFSHLQNLRDMANGDESKRMLLGIECKLCSENVPDVSALRVHLSSLNHRIKEEAGNYQTW